MLTEGGLSSLGNDLSSEYESEVGVDSRLPGDLVEIK
jgi:hypothetical protein